MTIFKQVWTLRRGIIDPPESLDAENQRRAEEAVLRDEPKVSVSPDGWRQRAEAEEFLRRTA